MTLDGTETPGALARASISGQFEVTALDGRSLLPRGRKSRGILAVLLWQYGRAIHREQLVDLFWSDRERAQGLASLRQSLTELRSALGDLADQLLDVTRNDVAVRAEHVDVDVWDRAGGVRLDATEPLLYGVGPIAPVFDDWIDQRRREFRAEQVRAAERQMLDSATESDAYLAAAEALLHLEPQNEPAARAVIQALGLRGNLARARTVFDDLSAALRADGFEVGTATREALHAARSAPAGTRPAATVVRNTGPPSVAIGEIEGLSPQDNGVARLFTASLASRAATVAEFRSGAITQMPGADYVLAGILVRDDTQIHAIVSVTTQSDGVQITSVEADVDHSVPVSDLSTLTDRVIARILPAIEQNEIRHLPADQADWTAYHHYLRARHLIATAENPDYMDRAEPHLQEAVRLEPEFLPPYPYLISSLNSGGRATRPGIALGKSRDLAIALARRFLILDARNPNAHLAMAWCRIRNFEFDLAEQSLIEVERLRLYDANRVNSLGTAYVVLGDHERGERYYALARQLMVNDLDYMNTDLGELHYFRRDYTTALKYLSMGEARNPAFSQFLRAATYAQLGRLDEARREAERALHTLSRRWVGPEPFSVRDAVRWYFEDFPMRRQMDLDNLREGLTKAGFSL